MLDSSDVETARETRKAKSVQPRATKMALRNVVIQSDPPASHVQF